jgi:hypothetical protein
MNQLESSRRAVQAAINLRAALTEIRELAGSNITANQAEKNAEKLLESIAPLAPLAPQPYLLTTSKPSQSTDSTSIVDCIAGVLGSRTMDVAQITAELQTLKKISSTRGIRYVGDILSRNSNGRGLNRFARVKAGTYKLVTPKKKLVFRTGP